MSAGKKRRYAPAAGRRGEITQSLLGASTRDRRSRTDGTTRKGRDRDDGPREMKNERKRHCVHSLSPLESLRSYRSITNKSSDGMLGPLPRSTQPGEGGINIDPGRTDLGRASTHTIVLLSSSQIFLIESPHADDQRGVRADFSFFFSPLFLSFFLRRIDPPRD